LNTYCTYPWIELLLILAADHARLRSLVLRGAVPGGHYPIPLVGRGFISSCVMTKMSDRSTNAISMIIAFTICGIMIFAAYLH
jgi:hypothetical protein